MAFTGYGYARAFGTRTASAQAQPLSGDLIGQLTAITTQEDTILHDVAWQYDLGIPEISAVNQNIDPWVPGVGRTILLPTAHLLPAVPREGVVINKSELRLYHFAADGGVSTHAVGIGRDGHATPDGRTTIVRKRRDPTWYPTENTRRDRPELAAQVGPGPDNPLGDRAMYFGWPTYLMHGTNKPYGVGRLVSRGCIRLYPETSRRLFDALPVGTPVHVIEQPIKVGWHEGGLFIEVHPAFDQLDQLEQSFRFEPSTPASLDAARQLIQAKVGDSAMHVDWPTVWTELRARRGIPVQIGGPVVEITGGVAPSWPGRRADTLLAEDVLEDGDRPDPTGGAPIDLHDVY